MYTRAKGKLPNSYRLHQTCERILCINPDHLKLVRSVKLRSM